MQQDRSRDRAEALALQALAWLAGSEDLLPRFLAASGLGAADLQARAAEPEVLAAVLDFLLQDDAWITGFCDANGLPYTAPGAARASLPGGETLHWT
jgi:hypothetical protein